MSIEENVSHLSFVYIDDNKIWQKQYGKCVEIQFSDIQYAELTIGFAQGYYHVVIHSYNKKIILQTL